MVDSSTPFGVSDKNVVLSGGGGNLGPIWARFLLDAGARVYVCDLKDLSVDPSYVDLLGQFADQLKVFQVDVTDSGQIANFAKELASSLDKIDVLINNAGLDTPPGSTASSFLVEDYPSGVFAKVLEVNLLGAFKMCQEFGRYMRATGGGSIINIGSMYGTTTPKPRMYDHMEMDPPFIKPPAYGASKAGLLHLTRYLAVHWGGDGIRSNSLSPGGVRGKQDPQFVEKFEREVPLGRMADFDDLRGPLLFLASDASAYVNGTDLLVDGGFSL